MKQSRIIAVALGICTLSAGATAVSQAEPTPRRRARQALELRMDAVAIRAGLESHDRALHIKAGWIRDPYIMLAPDGYYYLTGTTPNPDEPREQSNPYNTGLGRGSIVGYHLRIWRSKDLVSWEYMGEPFSLLDGYWAKKKPEKFRGKNRAQWRLWAPEVHFLGGKWHLVHTSPGPERAGSNLAVAQGDGIKGPFAFPLGDLSRAKHDPSLFQDDDGTVYLLWRNTLMAPLKKDMSGFAAEPVRIDPSGSRPGPDGKPISRIGHEGATIRKIGKKYVHFGTAWSTDRLRKGTYNLYYCTSDKITGPYGPRRFAGRFLGHGTPFKDKAGKWWCTAFFNANVPPVVHSGTLKPSVGGNAYTINEQGVTIVPLDVRVLANGDVRIRAKDPAYADPGPEEVQRFHAQSQTTGNTRYSLVQDSDKPAFDLTPDQTRMASCYRDKAGIYHLFADYMKKKRGSWNAVIRYYKSKDLYHWEYVSTVARHGEVGDPDARGCSSPHVYATDEKIYLFYGGTSRPVGGKQDIWAKKGKQGYFSRQFILAIAKADKEGAPKGDFVKHGVILEPGDIGKWDSMRMDGPCVVPVGDTLHLFYNAFDANKDRNRVRVGYAKASVKELKFVKHPKPILSVPGGGEMPRVFKTGSQWHMFYLHHGNLYSQKGGYKWQHHTSSNGIDWELSDPFFFDGHPSAFPPDIMLIYGMNGQMLDRPKLLVAGSENGVNKLWLYNLNRTPSKPARPEKRIPRSRTEKDDARGEVNFDVVAAGAR